jgi:hypothetical protein
MTNPVRLNQADGQSQRLLHERSWIGDGVHRADLNGSMPCERPKGFASRKPVLGDLRRAAFKIR